MSRLLLAAVVVSLAGWATPLCAADPEKPKLLMIESLPRYDFRFTQRELLRNTRVDARFHLTDGDAKVMKSGPPWVPAIPATAEDLAGVRLLVLGDLPAAAMSEDQMKLVRRFVVEGGGTLVVVAGRWHALGSYVGTPLGELLPVEVKAVKFPPTEEVPEKDKFAPVLTKEGEKSALFRRDRDGKPILAEMFWHYPVERLRPAAVVLLTHPTKKTEDGNPMPLVAGHAFGKGYVLFVGVEEFWRGRLNKGDVAQLDYAGAFVLTAADHVRSAAAAVIEGIGGKQ